MPEGSIPLQMEIAKAAAQRRAFFQSAGSIFGSWKVSLSLEESRYGYDFRRLVVCNTVGAFTSPYKELYRKTSLGDSQNLLVTDVDNYVINYVIMLFGKVYQITNRILTIRHSFRQCLLVL